MVDVASLSDSYELSEAINIAGGIVDSDLSKKLQDTFLRSPGVNQVSTIVIENSVEAEDLTFLCVFEHVDNVTIYSKSLLSLKGLEKLKKLDSLIIHMGGTKQPDLSILKNHDLKFLKVTGVNSEVIEMLSVLKICDLRLLKLETGINIASLSSCKIERLLLSESFITCLNGLDKFDTCKLLELYALRKLTTLSSVPPNLERLTIQACNKLEFDELLSSLDCQHLEIISCKCPVELTQVFGISNLKTVQVIGTPVKFRGDLPDHSNVERAYIENISLEYRREIQKRYPNLEMLK